MNISTRFAGLGGVAALAVGLIGGAASAVAVDITGAGATFPYPLYAKWAAAYKTKTGVGMNYQSIGSGGGIKQIQNKTVDFGASDMPLKPEELEKDGLTQFPTVIGGDVPVFNVKEIKSGELKLTGAVIADIFLGRRVQPMQIVVEHQPRSHQVCLLQPPQLLPMRTIRKYADLVAMHRIHNQLVDCIQRFVGALKAASHGRRRMPFNS